MESFNYGRYDQLYADPRTAKILKAVDELAVKMKVRYALIGGLASYIHVKKNPEDFPDIDFLLHCPAPRAKQFAQALEKKPHFKARFIDFDEEAEMMFAAFIYGGEIQVEAFTSSDQKETGTKRAEGVEIEMIEPLIIKKLIRGTQSDVRVALDLLAFSDYDKRLVSRIASEYRATGMLQSAAYFARRMAVGKMSKEGIDNVVRRLAQGNP